MIGDMAGKAVRIAPGVTTFQLPDGTIIPVEDYRDRPLYATLDVSQAVLRGAPMDPFQTGRSQAVVGSHGRPATLADTNLMRPGHSGLPTDCEMIVTGWHAVALTSAEIVASDAAQAWFAVTVARLWSNGKTISELPLLELLRAMPGPVDDDAPVGAPASATSVPMPVMGQRLALPARIREHLGFGVEISPQSTLPGNALIITLAHVGVTMSLRIFLTGLYKMPVL